MADPLTSDNPYTRMQHKFYEAEAANMAIENHRGHDFNPDYYGLLLSDIVERPLQWRGKRALDFGCGSGRNIDNLLCLAEWEAVYGCDISSANIKQAEAFLLDAGRGRFELWVTSGIDLLPLKSDDFDFVMSTIVLQHIPVWKIRHSILTDIYRVLRAGGLFSFQMAVHHAGVATYYENVWDAHGTNGAYDVSVDNVLDLINELRGIGFGNIQTRIRPEWDANTRQYADPGCKWLFIKTWKPENTSFTPSIP